MYIVTVGVSVKHQKQNDSVDLDVIAHYAKVKYIFFYMPERLKFIFWFYSIITVTDILGDVQVKIWAWSKENVPNAKCKQQSTRSSYSCSLISVFTVCHHNQFSFKGNIYSLRGLNYGKIACLFFLKKLFFKRKVFAPLGKWLVSEQWVLLYLDCEMPGSNLTGGGIPLMTLWHFIAQSLSLYPSHHLHHENMPI